MYNLNPEGTRVRIEIGPERVGTLDGTISLPTEVFITGAQTTPDGSVQDPSANGKQLFVSVMPH